MKINLLIFFLISLLKLVISDYEIEKDYINLCTKFKLLNKIPIIKNPPKISIIIPCYNRAEFIRSSIRSIQNQNFSDFEIIVIDDGSKDESVDIIEKEANRDPRIKLIKNYKNRGTIYSRYIGALNAISKYMLILDSDDLYCTPKALQILYNKMEEEDVDMIHFEVLKGYPDKALKMFSKISPKYFKYVEQPELKHYNVKNNMSCYQWNKIYKRRVYLKAYEFATKDYYEEHHTYLEDRIITYSIYRVANSYFAIHDHLLWYNDQPNSAHGNPYKYKKLHDLYRTLTFLYLRGEKDDPDGKIEFGDSIESALRYTDFIYKAIIKTKEGIVLYLDFCELTYNENNISNKAKNIIHNLCGKLGYKPKKHIIT